MSDKKNPVQLYSNSHIPSDLLVPTLGENYGLDGFEDMQYGLGVLEGVLDPDLHPAPAFPTGLNKGAEMDLSGVMEDTAGLADLDWLADAVQDPDRLPESPVAESIPELEQAWGVDRRTDGVRVLAQDLDQARYESALDQDPRLIMSAADMELVIVRAMRRSAMGHNLDEILIEAAAKAGAEAHRIGKAMRMVADEHGLAGNVFIRMAAFPELAKGKWGSVERKATKGARYILVSDRDLGSVRIQDGRCTVTGKTAVTTVPWDAARKHYRHVLRLSGRDPAGSDSRIALRLAFLMEPAGPKTDGSSLPVYQQDDSTTLDEAFKQIRAVATSHEEVELSDQHVRQRIESWEKAGLITSGIARGILASDRTPNRKLDAALMVVKAVKKKAFSGAPNIAADAAQDRQGLRLARLSDARDAKKAKLDRIEASRRSRDLDDRVAQVQGQIERGARGQHLKDIIARLIPIEYAAAAVRRLAPIIKKADALRSGSEQARYRGPVFERAQHSRQASTQVVSDAIDKAASAAGVKVGEIKGLMRWVAQNMSEGFAGQDLTDLVSHRFSKRVVTASTDLLHDLRAEHEGLSGFLYVDAAAYATPSGAAGCEKGSVRHRVNQIPAVLAMSRCATCTLASQTEDGASRCSVYDKVLMQDLPSDADTARAANIRSTEMTDAEATASLFNPSSMYDPSEYGLKNAEYSETTLDSYADQEAIGDVVFGGFTWE
jgi:hypothetical protein